MADTKLNIKQVNTEIIDGYEESDEQSLFYSSNKWQWKKRKLSLRNFSMNNYCNANIVVPSNYTSAQVFLHFTISVSSYNYEGSGQVTISTSNDSACIGFAGSGSQIELWNGSSNIRNENIKLSNDRVDYWLRLDNNPSGTSYLYYILSGSATLYYMLDNNYNYYTLPKEISNWTLGVSHSSFTYANKYLIIGYGDQYYCPNSTLIKDIKMVCDNAIVFDLQDESQYTVYGNLQKQIRFE